MRLAIRCGLSLHRIGMGSFPFAWLKDRATIFYILHTLLVHGDDIEWHGGDLFVEKERAVAFHLCQDDGRWRSYFDSKGRINFDRTKDGLYAQVQGLRFHLPEPFPAGVMELKDTFLDDCYGLFDVKGSMVLDIGAFIGDTAIYFARKGAAKVVAYEPVVPIYHLAEENVRLNGFENKIQVINEAISDSEGLTKLRYDKQCPGSSSVLEGSNNTLNIKMGSISYILKSLGHVDLLKIDCEGTEWKIIRSAIKTGALKLVDKIIMEIHGGQIEEMESLLKKANFKVTRISCSNVRRIFYGEISLGVITATQIETSVLLLKSPRHKLPSFT